MESFSTALLRIKRISDTAMLLAIAMQQEANPNGVVEASPDQLREAVNKLFGRRISGGDILRGRAELIEAGLLLSDTQVRPLESTSSQSLTRQEAEDRFYNKIHDDGSRAAPDNEFSELHTRFYGALLAVHMAPAMMKLSRAALRDENDDVVLIEGRRRQVHQLTWDYGTAAKLIKQYGIDYIVDTCFRIWPTVRKNNPTPPVLDAEAPDIREKLSRYRSYFIGALGQPIQPDDEEEPIVMQS